MKETEQTSGEAAASSASGAPEADAHERILDASLALAARRSWDEVSLHDIAGEAGVTLAGLHAAYRDKTGILLALGDRIDQEVLEATDLEMAGEPPRERLFDAMMARFDVLRPHRAAVRSIANALSRSPADLLRLREAGMRSMIWTLEAAGIDTAGPLGQLRAQGLAVVFARVLRVWLEDDDPGMAKTMVALDRRLREGERAIGLAEGLSRMFGRFGGLVPSRGGRRHGLGSDPDEAEVGGSGI